MKRLLLAILAIGGAMSGMAQDTAATMPADTMATTSSADADTIRVGGMIIIKKKGEDGKEHTNVEISPSANKRKKPSNLSTNWWILDFGFANWNDKTNYPAAVASGMLTSDFTSKEQLELKTGKSVNVNIWFFMQRLNIVKHVVNLKYGLGLELNNYHFDDERVRFQENPTKISLDPAYDVVDKNKLAADYITVPVMLNFNFTPDRKRGFGFSAGVSAGYLYSARQKIKNGDDKDKLHDDFGLRDFKISYIGELSLGPVRLYGSYAVKSMWENNLDMSPYNVGIRLSNW